jgi:predicted HD phosphohydrolase
VIRSVDELFSVLERSAEGEDEPGLSLLAHGLQCAHLLAVEHPDDVELQVAGLVHDIGGAVDPDAAHDRLGARLVRGLLGDRVADLVGGHVRAKRYLVTRDPAYRSRLSARSIETLAWQGDELDDDGIDAIERSPHFGSLLALRRADDRAKAPGRVVPDLASWRPVVEQVSARSPKSTGDSYDET